MSYSLKYWNEFKNYYDETVRVEILGRSFSGTATEVKTSSTPLVISYLGSDTEIYNPIVGSQAKIKLLSETDFQFIDLHNSDSRAHRVDIYKEGVLDWTGWVLPDLFSEPYVAPPYFVEVTARCGLGELQESIIPTEITELATAPITTSQPLLYSIIGNALLSLDSDLKLNSAVNLFFDSNDYQPFPYTRINLSAYEGKSWYEAISDILLTFGARLYQMGGYWWIVRIKELRESLSYEQYTMDIAGHNTSITITGKLTTFLIGRPEGSQIVNNSPTLDINPAWKEFTWVQDLDLDNNLLKNSSFSEWYEGFIGDGIYYIKDWTVVGVPAFGEPEWPLGQMIGKRISNSGDSCALFTQIGGDNYIYQETESILEKSESQKLAIIIVYDVVWSTIGAPTGDTAEFRVRIENIGTTIKYLAVNDDNNTYWTDEPSDILLSEITVTVPVYKNGEALLESFRNMEIEAPGIEQDGSIKLTIYSSTVGTLKIMQASISFSALDNENYIEKLTTNISINPNNIYNPNDITVVGGDLPVVTNNRVIWNNCYRKTTGEPTEEWHEKGSEINTTLLKLIGNDYSIIHKLPQFKLSLPILSQGIKFDSCIVDYQVLPRKYVCTSADLDYQTCIFSGTFMEFAPWEDSEWILATGSWNDEGIWIDTETWKDN